VASENRISKLFNGTATSMGVVVIAVVYILESVIPLLSGSHEVSNNDINNQVSEVRRTLNANRAVLDFIERVTTDTNKNSDQQTDNLRETAVILRDVAKTLSEISADNKAILKEAEKMENYRIRKGGP